MAGDQLAHARRGVRPRHAEAPGDMRLDLRTEAEDEATLRVEVQVVRDLRDGTQSAIQTEYLVGADGHRSTVRASLGIDMEGPDDLGRFLSILFRADLSEVIGEARYGLYTLPGPIGPDGPPMVVVPSGVDDRFVLGVPLPPQMDDATTAAAFSLDCCTALVRDAAGRPELEVEMRALRDGGFGAARGYEVPRCTSYLGAWIRHGTWYPDRQLRLFDRRGTLYEACPSAPFCRR